MTVAGMLDDLPASEISEWEAVERIYPFGGMVDDYRAALAAAAIYNVNRGKDTPVVSPFDLIPWHEREEPKRVVDPEAVRAALTRGRKQ